MIVQKETTKPENRTDLAGRLDVLVMRFRKFKELHSWFCRKSRSYIGVGYGEVSFTLPHVRMYSSKYRLRDALYWPIAWCKFMWYSRHDIYSAYRLVTDGEKELFN